MILVRAFFVAVGLIVVWQAIILVFAPPAFMLPAPVAVFEALRDRPNLWRVDAVTTATETVIGLVAGTALGMLLALVMSFLPTTKRMLLPLMVVSQALPVFAIAPLIVIWFGYGIGSKVVMAALIIFFPVASAFHDGLKTTNETWLDLARGWGATRAQTLFLVRIPAALPSLASGLKIAATLAPIGAIVGEWAGASGGLGYVMLQANARVQTDIVFACIIVLAASAFLLRFAVAAACDRLVFWQARNAIG